MIIRLLLLALVLTGLPAQQLRLRQGFIHNEGAAAWELAEEQSGAEAVLNQFLPAPSDVPMVWPARWLRQNLALPGDLVVIGDFVAAVPERLAAHVRLVTEVAAFLRRESADPDVFFQLEDFRLLGVLNDDGTPFSLERVSGVKRFDVPLGYWVWKVRQGRTEVRVRTRVTAQLPFAQASETFVRGEQVTFSKVALVYGDIASFTRRPLTAADLRTHWTALNYVRSGEWLYARNLAVLYSVTAHLPVSVRVQRRGIAVEMRGTALDSGMTGDRIRVRLTDSAKTLQGVITGGGEVFVETL